MLDLKLEDLCGLSFTCSLLRLHDQLFEVEIDVDVEHLFVANLSIGAILILIISFRVEQPESLLGRRSEGTVELTEHTLDVVSWGYFSAYFR